MASSAQEEESSNSSILLLWLQLDSDADGVKNSADAFPQDASETTDTDRDGIGNNADVDDDADGVADAFDAFPLDASEWVDSDGDGTGNNSDLDDDGDGFSDDVDVFPLNSAEWLDTDADGLGDNADIDDDNDGTIDENDSQPLKPESVCPEYLEAAPENTFRYCWEESIDDFDGDEYSSTVIAPIEVSIGGNAYEIPSNSYAERLALKYGLVLDSQSGWTQEQAYAIHQILERIPLVNGDSLEGLVLSLSTDFLTDDILFSDTEDTHEVVLGLAAFENATPRMAQIEGRRGIYFSNRLHRALVRLVTKNGTDANQVDKILRERFGVTTVIDDYSQLTGETADRFQPFQPEELVQIISIFEEMPSGYHRIEGLSYLVRRLNGTCNPYKPCYVPAIAWTGSGYIEFLESAFESDSIAYVHRLIIHEKAHFLWAHVFDDKLKQSWIETGGWYQCTEKSSGWCSTSQTEFVSAYAHLKNPDEDFAESAADFIINPDIVRSRAPDKYSFIRDRVMQGTVYIARIREDLTFTVYNLFPDYVYPGKVKRIRVEVAGAPDEDKDVTVIIDIHALDLAQEGILRAQGRVESSGDTYFDLWLYGPESGELTTQVTGHHTLSKYAKAGLWSPQQLRLDDAVGNSRYLGLNDFGWRMYVNNPQEDLEPPVYVPGSATLSLGEAEINSQLIRVITASWEVIEPHPRGPNGCYAALNDEFISTYSLQEYGASTETGCSINFAMPDYMPNGSYALNYTRNIDAALNESRQFFSSDLPDNGGFGGENTGEEAPSVIIESATPDTQAPDLDLNALSVTATPVNPSAPNGETIVEFTFRVKDDISGYSIGAFNLRDPQGNNFNYYHYQERRGNFYPLPGELEWTEYTATVILPPGSAPGIWGVSEFTVRDRAGNFKSYDFVEIVRFDVVE